MHNSKDSKFRLIEQSVFIFFVNKLYHFNKRVCLMYLTFIQWIWLWVKFRQLPYSPINILRQFSKVSVLHRSWMLSRACTQDIHSRNVLVRLHYDLLSSLSNHLKCEQYLLSRFKGFLSKETQYYFYSMSSHDSLGFGPPKHRYNCIANKEYALMFIYHDQSEKPQLREYYSYRMLRIFINPTSDSLLV